MTLLALPDDGPVDALDVTGLWQAWADELPDPEKAPTLEQVCDRAGLPETAASQPGDWPGWTAGLARRVAAELGTEWGLSAEAYLGGKAEAWRAALADERAGRRHRRAGLRRRIAAAEQRARDLVADRVAPEAGRADLLARYQAAHQRAFEKAFKALRTLQDDRRARARRRKAAD